MPLNNPSPNKHNHVKRLRWLYIVFFGARGIGTNGASARVFKGKEKINMAARLLSRVASHLLLSFLSPTSIHQKTPKIMFKNTLLSSSPDMVKLRSQFAVLIAPRTERKGGLDRTRRKSQSGHGVLFMVRGFVLSSLGDETPKTTGMSPKAQVTTEKQPPLRDGKGRFSGKKLI